MPKRSRSSGGSWFDTKVKSIVKSFFFGDQSPIEELLRFNQEAEKLTTTGEKANKDDDLLLPFTKRRCADWSILECDEAFIIRPQLPHFAQVKKLIPVLRETMALAMMEAFIDLVNEIRVAEPDSICFDDKLEIVEMLKFNGFDVQFVEDQIIHMMKRLRDEYRARHAEAVARAERFERLELEHGRAIQELKQRILILKGCTN